MLKKKKHTVKSQRKVPQSHLAKSTMAAPSVTWLLLPAVVLPPALKASVNFGLQRLGFDVRKRWEWLYIYIYIHIYIINTGHDLMRIADP